EILSEFATVPPATPITDEKSAATEPPVVETAAETPEEAAAPTEEPPVTPDPKPAQAPVKKPVKKPAKAAPKGSAKGHAKPSEDNVIEFPERDHSLGGKLTRILEKADDYADQMFAEEVPDPELKKKEALLPGVDWEDTGVLENHPHRPRRVVLPAPDIPPAELAKRYNRGQKLLWTRTMLCFLPGLALLYLSLAAEFSLYLPPVLAASFQLQTYCALILLGIVGLLGCDLLFVGLVNIFRLNMGAESLIALAFFATVADGLTAALFSLRQSALPYCVVSAFGILFGLWGRFLKRHGLRISCRTAAAAKAPYAVTLDEGKWNGRDTFCKWSGSLAGYGSQIQAPDGAQRVYRIASPLLAVFCVVFALLSSVGAGRPAGFLWCLSATLCAAASFSGLLIFAAPFSALAGRLSKSGAAVGGWDGIRDSRKAGGALLTDRDLFPPGGISLNGVKVFEHFELNTVAAYIATMVRDSGSGLQKPLSDFVRTQGATHRHCTGLLCHEGGLTGTIEGHQITVGTAAFMTLMEVPLPQGLSVKSAAFCAVDGVLAGIFALNYGLHSSVRPSIGALIAGRITPVLATRDFTIIPEMLKQKFKLPVEKMEFPNLDRRRELSEEKQNHSGLFAAVLCREGLMPFADAVVGGKRLVTATKLSATISVLGSAIGVLMAFYLTFIGAYASISPMNLLVSLLLWAVPTVLISGWVDRY
ncbi:MAG: hypothetical protein RR502_04590, partial [Oscillospiraceae bacterium]